MTTFARGLTLAAAASRAGEWWEYKLLPLLAVFYASALAFDLEPRAWLVGGLTLLGAVIPGAIFVSVVNDLTDRADDAAAGKVNRMAQAPLAVRVLALGAPLAVGLAWCMMWRDHPLVLLPYLAAWLSFTLYSVPPLRLKHRGWAGALADAGGAHLFPAVLAVMIAADAAHRWPPTGWTIAIGTWAFAYGLRGIFWHQLGDRTSDRKTGAQTLAVRYAPEQLRVLARWVIFPVEAIALAAVLTMARLPLVWAALAVYGVSVAQRALIWKLRPVLVEPAPRSLIVMAEFYAVLLPLALIASLALVAPAAGLVAMIFHLALFHGAAWRMAKDLARIEFVQMKLLGNFVRRIVRPNQRRQAKRQLKA